MVPISTPDPSDKLAAVSESVIREMTRKAIKYGATNLSQGYPGFPTPKELLSAVTHAVENGYNQYSITWGLDELRRSISHKLKHFNGLCYDHEEEITVTCGTSEAFMSSVLSIVCPGDEVIVPQPFYENYVPAVLMAHGKPVFCDLYGKNGINREALEGSVGNSTKVLLLNNPHNPTGTVLERRDLEFIRDICVDHDILVIADEIYERVVFDDSEFISIPSLEGMRERSVIVNGFSKTYSVTGWRVGYAAAPSSLMSGIRKVHDYTTVCAPTPLQKALCTALTLPDKYYEDMIGYYRVSRDLLYNALIDVGLDPYLPRGAYYMMVDISESGQDDLEFTDHLVRDIGIAVVPGSSFYNEGGRDMVRFSFSVSRDILSDAITCLDRLSI